MDAPQRSAQGQTIQKGSTPLGSDMAPVDENAGSALRMQVVDGKDGSVKKLGMAQTDYTDAHAGPSPQY